MIFKRKNVLCSKCGFLGWPETSYSSPITEPQSECPPLKREQFQNGLNIEARDMRIHIVSSLFCHRLQWAMTRSKEGNDNHLLLQDEIRQSRQCRYYIKYHPGYTPAEHKELISETKTRRTIIFATLLGALVGAAAAIIAGKLV